MEGKCSRICIPTSGRVTSAATTASNGEDDDIGMPSGYRALPIANFRTYYDLVATIYSTSTALILGNSLEWLDFSIYGYSSAEISTQLFGGSKTAYWGSFGLGFAMRPLGAYVLGKLSDEKSRKLSFIVSMLAMSTSTALMSLIPAVCNTTEANFDSYCVSNLWISAIPAICLRCVQGFSAGAAAGGVNVIQSELWSTTERKGAIAQSIGVQNVSGGGASMLSASIVYGLREAIGKDHYAIWGWRIAFLVVVPPSLFASHLMHRSTPESNEFAKCDGKIKDHIRLVEEVSENGDVNSLSSINELHDAQNITSIDEEDQFKDEEAEIGTADDSRRSLSKKQNHCDLDQLSFSLSPSLLLRTERCPATLSRRINDTKLTNTNIAPWWVMVAVITFSQFAISGFNNLTVFMVEFAQTNYGVTIGTSTLMQITGKAVQVLMTPFAATLGDIKGWHWTCAFGGTLCTVLALPMMIAGNFGGEAAAWIIVSGFFPIVSSFWILNAPLLVTSVFPVECRSRGTSMVLATAAGIAGFLPLMLEEIPNAYAQGFILTIIAALGTIGIIWIRNQAKRGNVKIYQRPELF